MKTSLSILAAQCGHYHRRCQQQVLAPADFERLARINATVFFGVLGDYMLDEYVLGTVTRINVSGSGSKPSNYICFARRHSSRTTVMV